MYNCRILVNYHKVEFGVCLKVASSKPSRAVIPPGSLWHNLPELKLTGGSKYEFLNPISL